jgi:C_GCAxxG_C_C family probable redox protein
MGNVCGAVTGAFLVLGLTYEIGSPTARQDIYHLVQEVARRFTARHGSIFCNELLGFNISTAEGLREIRKKKLTSTICPRVLPFFHHYYQNTPAGMKLGVFVFLTAFFGCL